MISSKTVFILHNIFQNWKASLFTAYSKTSLPSCNHMVVIKISWYNSKNYEHEIEYEFAEYDFLNLLLCFQAVKRCYVDSLLFSS